MKIGILTGGGDCPGLNAVIRAVTKSALRRGWEVYGYLDGFKGLVEDRRRRLTDKDVSGIIIRGGTILGTSNIANPFSYTLPPHGSPAAPADMAGRSMRNFRKLGLDALVAIGGDGTQSMSLRFHKLGLPVVGVPKTIDNDLSATDFTFGFDTALQVATEAVDRLHTTADAHDRVLIVETMGRYAGWIALRAGIAGGGDVILLPEMKYRPADVVAAIKDRQRRGKNFSIVVVSEGAAPEGGGMTVLKTVEGSTDPVRLGGVSYRVAEMIEKGTGIEARVVVLGHLQRGGEPTPFDRWLATGFGAGAAELIAARRFGRMVAVRGTEFTSVPLSAAVGKLKRVSPGSCEVRAALGVGASFGRADIAARLLRKVCS